MKAIHLRYPFVGLAMLAAAVLALALTPRLKVADQGPKINLEAMIPKQFGKWKLEKAIVPLINPALQSLVDKAYDQTLSRSYLNDKGDLIMLSVTYGAAQGDLVRVHLPEFCYPAQGFQIENMTTAVVDTGGTKLPVMRFVATQGQRIEPVTYWAVIGDFAVRGKWEQKLALWKYGLTGKIPSGILIRVSTISANESQAYRTEELFLRDMLGAVPMQYHTVLTGSGL